MTFRLPGPRSAAWLLPEAGASAAFSLISMLVIGRVIGPHEAGMGAVAVSAFLLLDVAGAALFPDALVQRPHLSPVVKRTAQTASVLVSLVGAVLLVVSAAVMARSAGNAALLWLAIALAPFLPLSAASGAASGLALREERYRLMALRVLVGQPIALTAGLLAAAAGMGAWAMIVNQAVATSVVFLLFLLGGQMALRPALDGRALRELWPIAGPQIAALTVTLGRYRVFILCLGMLVTGTVLAQAHFAFRMLDAVLMMVWQAVARLAMPRLCALQHDRHALAQSYGDIAQLQAMLGLPVAIGIALVADDLVRGLLGPAWEGTAEAAQVAGLLASTAFLYGNYFSLFVALGRTRLNFHVAVANLTLPLIALLILRPTTPAGIALAWTLPIPILTPILGWIVLRNLDRPLRWLLARLAPALAATLAMAPAVLLARVMLDGAPPLLRLAGAILAGACVFAGTAWLMLGARLPAALRGPAVSPAPAE